jgi:pimeloyl-ACP methyl ester carboxylesterase
MNRYYRYPNIDRWHLEPWSSHQSPIDPLMRWLQTNGVEKEGSFVPPDCEKPKEHPNYRAKTRCIDLPEVVQQWQEQGLRYASLEQGTRCWISLVPEQAAEQLPVLVVPVKQSVHDPWWAMKALSAYQSYLEMAAKGKDVILLFLVAEDMDQGRIYVNILQEAVTLYPISLAHIYLDVTAALGRTRLDEIPNFVWRDSAGEPVSADAMIESFGSLAIPVLNISGRWGSRDSQNRSLAMDQAMNDGVYDRNRFIHSAVGRRMMEGLDLEYRCESLHDPAMQRFLEQMGLESGDHETKGARWITLSPKGAVQKLPLLIIMQEVCHGNEHLAVSALATYRAYLEIAGQGECVLLFFALEHPDDNDLLAELIPEAAACCPVDLQRVYITGHSHNGFFALHFAIRHPQLITAVATLGNPAGLQPPEERGEPILSYTDQQIEQLSQVDMPLINLCGYCEGFGRVPQESDRYAQWIVDWQRRLKASRCQVKTEQEIRSVRGRGTRAQRKLAVPADRSETFWQDGVEHYIVDIRNQEGRYHLRLVSSENMPHMVTPFMLELSWSFLRRFARNHVTNRIQELY